MSIFQCFPNEQTITYDKQFPNITAVSVVRL